MNSDYIHYNPLRCVCLQENHKRIIKLESKINIYLDFFHICKVLINTALPTDLYRIIR